METKELVPRPQPVAVSVAHDGVDVRSATNAIGFSFSVDAYGRIPMTAVGIKVKAVADEEVL